MADLASEDATVVIGTVIDPEMGDELRVTVVATGLGQGVAHSHSTGSKFHVVRNGTTGQSEPAFMEGSKAGVDAVEDGTSDLFSRQENIDYLDIPSFLRIQAD